ncbi:MAG: insulinase family protein [Rickettsiales bacterium]|jgi:Zn-dependent M16 (insulinase) family peptidase|nr:insulinase family protein [Rickettsiales bacterium]
MVMISSFLSGKSVFALDPRVGSSISGFRVLEKEIIHNNGREDRIFVFEHMGTGARVLYVNNIDPHRFFGIVFSAPALDSTGVVHILEHSVLSSSHKYKGVDLFFDLAKFTPATFLNAYTKEGQVCYLFQTLNNSDFTNLMDVYINAALFPELSEDTFKREGWNLEADGDGNLSYNGVVFNEMKTAYSDPQEHFWVESFKNLFPGLEFDYGGLPNHIIDLTHENLLKYHRDTHNPSNSLTIIYGRGNIKKELGLLNSNFKKFERREPLRPNFEDRLLSSPVKKVLAYPAAKDEEHSYLVFSYVLGDVGDVVANSKADSLAFLLAGYEEAPLKREIVKSGLATDVGVNIDSGKNKTALFIVFEGVEKKNEGKIEFALEKVLREVADFGFGEMAEEAALSMQKYRIRNESRFKFAFSRNDENIFSINDAYMLGKDYKLFLDGERRGAEFEKITGDRNFWRTFLRKNLLENRQRAEITFRPDDRMFDRQNEEINSKLAVLKKNMSGPELEQLRLETERFRKASAAEIETNFPRISLRDWKDEKLTSRVKRENFEEVKLLHSDTKKNGNGLAQIAFAFNINIPHEILPAVGIYSLLFDKLGSGTKSNADLYLEQTRILGHRIDRSILLKPTYGGEGIVSRFIVKVRGFDDALGEKSFELLNENLFGLDYDGQKNEIRNILDRALQEIEMDLKRDGYFLFSDVSERSITNSYLGGEKYYLYLKDLLEDWDAGFRKLLADLNYVRSNLFVRKNLVVGVVGSKRVLGESRKYIKSLPRGFSKGQARDFTLKKLNQARIVPARNYRNYLRCDSRGKTWELHFLPALLTWNYLYPEVRKKRGAYGSKLSMEYDQMMFYSYSDPNVANTFDVFRGAGEFLRNLTMSVRDFEGVKIKALAVYLHPRTDLDSGMKILEDYLIGRTDKNIENEYRTIRNLKLDDVKILGDYIDQCVGDSQIATEGPREGIESNKNLFDEIK